MKSILMANTIFFKNKTKSKIKTFLEKTNLFRDLSDFNNSGRDGKYYNFDLRNSIYPVKHNEHDYDIYDLEGYRY
jgi:hypothetical protein